MKHKFYTRWLFNLWPPFLFTGIHLTKISKDFRQISVKLSLRFWNANYVGTQYGGSIFSMADPFYMIMLIENLGRDYTVWDKSSTIRFLKPGRTNLLADFQLTEEDLALIRSEIEEHGKVNWERTVKIKDTHDEVIAEVDKIISIKRKKIQDIQDRVTK